MSRPHTPAEARNMFLAQIAAYASYWGGQHSMPVQQRISGLAFSILNIIDGGAMGFPASIDLVLRVNPEDKPYLKARGENWLADHQIINDGPDLHELWFEVAKKYGLET